ncbi:hypothetical protein [Achromobacter marplatensis]|uniref:hypothetical protein n=1 Tax=Achromobacter marplatensis TaxID=470868 RepID=UPI0003115BD8|nr:hypothetical protein [Achromobacter marplatensis]
MAKRSKRDDFPIAVKRLLAERVGHRCSRPDCDVPTAGAATGGGVSSIGTAAHITAAAPGGPRYDSKLTPAQRAHADNGIWLCANHGREVDSDHHRFSIQQLREWKREAEERSSSRIGQIQPSRDSTIEQLKMAAQGVGKRFIPDAISNVHHAIADALKAEDPRFDVGTSYNGKGTLFQISANQPVKLGLTIQSELDRQEMGSRLRRLEEDGIPLCLEEAQLAVQGSPLFDTLLSGKERGKLELTPTSRRGKIKLMLTSPDGSSLETLAPVPARMYFGTKNARCEGSAYQGLLELKSDLSLISAGRAQLTIGINTYLWEGVDVGALEHFDDVFDFFYKCARGWKLSVELSCEGLPVCKSVIQDLKKEAFIQSNTLMLLYTASVRSLRKFLGIPVPACFDIPIRRQDAQAVNELGCLLGAEGKAVPGFRACVKMNPGVLELNETGATSLPQVLLEAPPLNIRVFDTTVAIPTTQFLILDVLAQSASDSSDPLDVVFTATATSKLKIIRGDEPNDFSSKQNGQPIYIDQFAAYAVADTRR